MPSSVHAFLLLVCLGFAAPSASAQGTPHLVPEVGPLAASREYEVILSEAFALPFDQYNVVARAVIRPSFGVESVVGVRRNGDFYEVFLAQPDSSLWDAYRGDRWVGSTFAGHTWSVEAARSVSVSWRYIPLGAKTAETVGAAWERAILDARYPVDVVVGVDGVSISFSRWVDDGRGMIAARTWSPPKESVAGALFDLGLQLEEYARGGDVSQNDLVEGADRVVRLLEVANSGQ